MKTPYYLVRGARYASGMSLTEAAKAIGISPATLVKAERGENIRVSSWRKISAFYALDKHVEYEDAVMTANSTEEAPAGQKGGENGR